MGGRSQLCETIKVLKNPLHDQRVKAGLRTRQLFGQRMKFVVRKHHRTDAPIAIAILWGAFVHTVVHNQPKFGELLDLLMENYRHSIVESCVEAFMVVDPYFNGTRDTPEAAILDMLLAEGAITPSRLVEKIETILIEEAN